MQTENDTTETMEIVNLEADFDLDAWLDELVRDAGPQAPVLRTPVWILFGLTRSVPAVLQLAGRRLALGMDGMPLFDVDLDEVESARFPWWWFGGGVRLQVEDEDWKLSFVRPNGAMDARTRLLVTRLEEAGGALALGHAVRKLKDVREGRSVGRLWRAVLTK